MRTNRLDCVLLNTTYEPIDIITSIEAMILVYKGKARIVEEHDSVVLRSATQAIPAPTQIVLNKYVKLNLNKPANLTNQNLFSRDNFTCVYCNRHKKDLRRDEFLTKDHVFPKSRGGRDTWLNLVTACSRCNNQKDNKTPGEADLILKVKPYVPSKYELRQKSFKKRLKQI
jgi:5-methylcytosine-specific restriction endonuclease McrA